MIRSFHPKAWQLEGDGFAVAFVGSSNLSLAALTSGVEWNLRAERASQPAAWARIAEATDALWGRAQPLTADWVAAYAKRASQRHLPVPIGEVVEDPPPDPAQPHEVQHEALAELRAARLAGRRRAVVVLATGLGKTWLAAFDYRQLWDELGRQPRLLFVAHRRELLLQAAGTFRRLIRECERDGDPRVGWFLEQHAALDAPLVFASVAKLARAAYVERLAAQSFDYVVIDEVHHATADSYRRVLQRLDPAFLLGLTATPERSDGADVLGMFDDFIAFRADLGRGVEVGRLVPFRYFGVRDELDYANIPWRNRRFDPDELGKAVQTEARMQTLWQAWRAHPGARSLVFCCSIAHADFVADWLAARGVRVARVYSAPGSDERDEALQQLASGHLDDLCAVDVFNEGVDVPAVDRVVMLRPTESGVVFLQQLGRGLRAAEGKTHLTVIDFVGNHAVFLERLRTVLSLGGEKPAAALQALLHEGRLELPSGCSVELQLEAKLVLQQRLLGSGKDEVLQLYRQLRDSRGQRPTAGELVRMGYSLAPLTRQHGTWLGFVREEGDLDEAQQSALAGAAGFLENLERTDVNKSFKLITLDVLLDADALIEGMALRDLALAGWRRLRRSPELFADVPVAEHLDEAQGEASVRRWVSYWRSNPVRAWTGAKRRQQGWFRVTDDDRFVLNLDVPPAWREAFLGLVRELVDYRLARYVRRSLPVATGFTCRVVIRDGVPALVRAGEMLPEGEVDARLPDGAVWQFRFTGDGCAFARPASAQASGPRANKLSELLRGWFEPLVATDEAPDEDPRETPREVRFAASPDGLWVAPVDASLAPPRPLRVIAEYHDLAAAARHTGQAAEGGARLVLLPVASESHELFAVRIAGTALDSGAEPLRDGDWAVFRGGEGALAAAPPARVVLVEVMGERGWEFQMRRSAGVVEVGGPTGENDGEVYPSALEASASPRIAATLHAVVQPDQLAPRVGTLLREGQIGPAFNLPALAPHTGEVCGHRFVWIHTEGMLVAPDRLAAEAPRHAGETSFVLAAVDGGFRYLGVGRWRADEGLWSIPEVDFATWRAWGHGRSVSRPLPHGLAARAEAVVEALLDLAEGERNLRQGDGHARILGRAARGGLRLAVGEGERTVSLTDLAWVIAAADDVAVRGGVLDEARVNRLRYLEGTPKGSTRWVDTGWALAAWRRGAAFAAMRASVNAPQRPLRADGSEVDATFRVEELDGEVTIVLEARGGKRGTAEAVNTEYAEGLRLVLERLHAAGLSLADAALDTETTRALPREARRLDVGEVYPVSLADHVDVARRLGRAQERHGKAAGATGGNPTRRVRLSVGGVVEVAGLVRVLVGGPESQPR